MKVIYLYTPLCGTCQLAGKLLNYIEILNGENVQIEKLNMNLHKEIALQYEIESVPCLLKIRDNQFEKLYAFSDVTTIYEWLKK